ncbi:phosphoenolpyruvate synthase [Herpetosiphon gulosus]|uniref:Rifamycin-inactivating phosphotransferase RphC n=1 Tax=Herpetosiphon gulosus TaxID=1973496 RepID=A0ABP9X0B4_9CHLR
MDSQVFEFQAIDPSKPILVGGKAANLAALTRIAGINVPDGFCVSTEAFNNLIRTTPALGELIDQASLLTLNDRHQIGELSTSIRQLIAAITIPTELHTAISHMLSTFDPTTAFAIRSSATTEDSPTTSFAGQHDSYLNIIGEAAILKHIKLCWASLFTERTMIYRIQQRLDHRNPGLAVIIQTMVLAQVAGTMFTADPITANRTIVSIEASFGLGEALVSGRVNADTYRMQNGKRIATSITSKHLAIYPLATGGTREQPISTEQQRQPALNDAQIAQLEQIGRTIERHFGQPQDIEWCLADNTFYIVQSRPITTLYPIPEANDQSKHVYISVGHQQMMTDAIKPLGLSLWQLTAARPMVHAGGRLFVDIFADLASPIRRVNIINALGTADPLLKDALIKLIDRGDFIPALPDDSHSPTLSQPNSGEASLEFQSQIENDPTIVANLIKQSELALAQLKQGIVTQSESALCKFILKDIQQLKQYLTNPQSFGVIMTAMNAAAWLNQRMQQWLGETNAADTLSQSVSNNITSAMGLALLDVADLIRPYPAIIEYLTATNDQAFLDELAQFEGGEAVRKAIMNYLESYGMRCTGEIDITRPRWSEKPATLIPMLLNNLKSFEYGASQQKFEHGRQAALDKEQELLERLQQLPDGGQKAAATKRVIDLLRNLIGYREYPKYHIVSRYFVYKQALQKVADQLVQAKVLREPTDLDYLTFDELCSVLNHQTLDYQLINQRKAEYSHYQKLTPPRVMTSDGEIITGSYQRDQLPTGALVGLPVSAGVIEGRARVILTIEAAELEAGDILVTTFTDPSWTPLFVAIKGLVTEVGGLMTHGSVIAREYGLAAVVGVENATKLIQDGQQIRVDGTAGSIELL